MICQGFTPRLINPCDNQFACNRMCAIYRIQHCHFIAARQLYGLRFTDLNFFNLRPRLHQSCHSGDFR